MAHPGCGDGENERLTTRACGGFELLVNLAVRMLVQLVEKTTVGVQSVHGLCISRECPEFGLGGLNVQAADVTLDVLPQRSRFDHRGCFVPDLFCLVQFGGGGVNLGSRLVVCIQHVQTDGS